MSDFDTTERPNRIPWPPLLLVLAIIVGSVLNAAIPLPFLPEGAPSAVARWVGTLMIIAAIALDIWAFLLFRRHQTTILPHQGSNQIVASGPFSVSRNPIYLGNLTIVAGIGLRANSLWFFFLLIPMAYLLVRLAIAREEAHLSHRFPEEWARYSASVHRWLGRSNSEPDRRKP